MRGPTTAIVNPNTCSVKPQLNYQLPLLPDSMIHHKPLAFQDKRIVYYRYEDIGRSYGVSRSRRVLSPQRLLKKFDLVRDFIQFNLGLPRAERDAILGILRYWAYYGVVYVKQARISEDEYISKATYWRAIRRLRTLGMINVINRYIIRPHAQISNLYRLDKLVLLIARYLAEHGTSFMEKWLQPYLAMPGSLFWRNFVAGCRSSPGCFPGYDT